jgi:hypothetical protein
MQSDHWSSRADRKTRIVLSIFGVTSLVVLVITLCGEPGFYLWGKLSLGALALTCFWTSWFAKPKFREELAHLLPWL